MIKNLSANGFDVRNNNLLEFSRVKEKRRN